MVNYPDEALSKHYKQYHSGTKPDFTFSILSRETNTVRRKIKEAFYIVNEKPAINDKDECSVLERYLVRWWYTRMYNVHILL